MNKEPSATPPTRQLRARPTARAFLALALLMSALAVVPTTTAGAATSCPNLSQSDDSLTGGSSGCYYVVIEAFGSWDKVCEGAGGNLSCNNLDSGRHKIDMYSRSPWGKIGSYYATISPPSNDDPDCLDDNERATIANMMQGQTWGNCYPGWNADVATSGWMPSHWRGWGNVTRGDRGGVFRVRWTNRNPIRPTGDTGQSYSDNGIAHAEFDISLNKSHYVSTPTGYGDRRVNQLTGNARNMRSVGRWMNGRVPDEDSRAHVQALIYIGENDDDTFRGSPDSIDITVVEWTTKSQRDEYTALFNGSSPVQNLSLNNNTQVLGEITNEGVPYYVFKRPEGDEGEKASYFVMRRWNQNYETANRLSRVDIREVVEGIDQLDTTENFQNWYVGIAGWEVTGGNGSVGDFRFKCYVIPAFTNTSQGTATDGCWR